MHIEESLFKEILTESALFNEEIPDKCKKKNKRPSEIGRAHV